MPRAKPVSPPPYFETDYHARKAIPIVTGLLDYFPLALIEVAKVSVGGNAQHNPGDELHWARDKSMDQMNTAVRHIMERGGCKRLGLDGKDIDGAYHLAKAIWRLAAQLQLDIEQERGLGPSRASR
jgi:dATP/dGTP diphosphohydrolase, N-terminal